MTESPNRSDNPIDMPEAGEIHLWFIQPQAGTAIRPYARNACRRILAGYMDCPVKSLHIDQGPYGKPRLNMPNMPPLAWNLSHSRSIAIMAVSRSEVGVDVEDKDRFVDALRLARRFFHKEEVEWLLDQSDDARRLAFLHLWTRKEALLKCHGHGLAYGMTRFACIPGNMNAITLEALNRQPITLYLYEPHTLPDIIVSLASEEADPRFRYFAYPDELVIHDT